MITDNYVIMIYDFMLAKTFSLASYISRQPNHGTGKAYWSFYLPSVLPNEFTL